MSSWLSQHIQSHGPSLARRQAADTVVRPSGIPYAQLFERSEGARDRRTRTGVEPAGVLLYATGAMLSA